MRSQLPEIPRSEITPLRFGMVETTAGEFFVVIRGQVSDPQRSSAVAFYVDSDEIVWRERPGNGPRNRAELEQLQAERERRDAAPKPRPAWMNP